MTILVLSILNGSSSFLHTIRTSIKAWMSLNFVKIPSHILELAPLEHLQGAHPSGKSQGNLVFSSRSGKSQGNL